ncbi:fatty acid desaturase family protein [Myxococcaceae bacterium GXIMD 01537]
MLAATAPRTFRITDVLSREEIVALHRRAYLPALGALAFTWGTIAAAFALVARWPSVLTVLVALVVIGGRQLALGILAHDASHGALLPSRRLNDFAGQWLCAVFIWGDLARSRRHHLTHHHYSVTEEDPDLPLVLPFPMPRAELAKRFAKDLLGVTGALRVAANLLTDLGFVAFSSSGEAKLVDQSRRTVGDLARTAAVNLYPVLVANAVLLGVLWLCGHPWLLLLWWGAWATTFNVFARVRSFVEHACTPDASDPLRGVRTVRVSFWERLTVAPHHVNFHLEHHLLQAVPFFQLPRLHRLLEERGVLARSIVSDGYLQVLREVTDLRSTRLRPVSPVRAAAKAREEEAAPPAELSGARPWLLPLLGRGVERALRRYQARRARDSAGPAPGPG